MKTSEMIAMLEENPKQKHEHIDQFGDRHELSVNNSGYLCYKKWNKEGKLLDPNQYSGGHFNGNMKMDFNWQPVREPVPVWEAVKALYEGKSITCDGGECGQCVFSSDVGVVESMDYECIREGKWFIND